VTEQMLSRKGLRLTAPEVGDYVTVRVRRQPKREGTLGYGGIVAAMYGDADEADAPQHYRINAIWRVVAVNGGQAVVECVTGYEKGKRREIWSIAHHEWFEASDLFDALEPRTAMVAGDLAAAD
jgi:hypothetical protein